MKQMKKDKFIKNWGNTRKKGKLRYVIMQSLILSASFFAGSLMIRLLKDHSIYLSVQHSLPYLAGALIGSPLGSLISWRSSEEKYNLLLKERI